MKKLRTKLEENKEFFYSVLFFITAIVISRMSILGSIGDLIDFSPNAEIIKHKLFDLGVFPIFYHVFTINTVAVFIFLFLSIYIGIKFIKKEPKTGKLITMPKNTFQWLATFQVIISLFFVALNISVLFYFINNSKIKTSEQAKVQKCPDDYDRSTDAGEAEWADDLKKWSDNLDLNPNANLGDWAKARHQFYIDNNCTEALKRYEQAKNGTADPARMKLINDSIEKMKNTLWYDAGDFGFSFDYPTDMSITRDPTAPRVFIIPNSYNGGDDEAPTAVVVTATFNNPPQTPLEWLKDPGGGGADLSKGYTKLNIDGQEAISVNGDHWIVVNTPDNTRQMSIATLPSENPSQSLIEDMSVIVNSIIWDK